MERKHIVELAEEIAEKSNCDMSQMDGREYESMWCGRAEFEKMVIEIFKEGQKYEREACAKIVENEGIGFADDDEELNRIASLIRARGKK